MKTLPPSQKLQDARRKLSSLPLTPLSVEQVKAQVKEHLQEAKEQMLRSGHAILAR